MSRRIADSTNAYCQLMRHTSLVKFAIPFLQSLIPIRAERLKQVSVVVRVFVRGISKQSAIGKY